MPHLRSCAKGSDDDEAVDARAHCSCTALLQPRFALTCMPMHLTACRHAGRSRVKMVGLSYKAMLSHMLKRGAHVKASWLSARAWQHAELQYHAQGGMADRVSCVQGTAPGGTLWTMQVLQKQN